MHCPYVRILFIEASDVLNLDHWRRVGSCVVGQVANLQQIANPLGG
jgi:hypothetical protein